MANGEFTLTSVALLLAAITLVLAVVLYRFPPAYRSRYFGYRTAAARRSTAAWQFAQRYAGRQLLLFGSTLVVLAVLGQFLAVHPTLAELLGALLVIGGLLLLYSRTERALAARFG